METVIAILVLAVLLTGFLTVFTPAAQGIRRSISTQQADRLKATLEKDMTTLRTGETIPDVTSPTGFDKAFTWIKEGNQADTAIFVYQYRAWNPNSTESGRLPARTTDGTLAPMSTIKGKPSIDYTVQTAARRANDTLVFEDLEAIVGPLFYVIPTQLVYDNNELVLGTPGAIFNPPADPDTPPVEAANPSDYEDAVITFSAAFYSVPSVSPNYINGSKFTEKFNSAAASGSEVKPVFVRNLAVRR